MSIIGFTADADYWCIDCAVSAYGADILRGDVPDREGNAVHPVYDTTELLTTVVCGACLADIYRCEHLGYCECADRPADHLPYTHARRDG